MTLTVRNIYYCPKCNIELKEKDICAIVRHTQKSCRHCHTDVARIRQEVKESFMKKFFEVIKKPLKVIGFLGLASITVAFGAWLTMILFNYAPVFKQIGEALGISGLRPKDWCLGFLAYILLLGVWKLYAFLIKLVTD